MCLNETSTIVRCKEYVSWLTVSLENIVSLFLIVNQCKTQGFKNKV